MPPARVRLTIEIELDSEPIAGSLQRADGDTSGFQGWIELVSLLEAAATTQRPDDGPSADAHRYLRKVR